MSKTVLGTSLVLLLLTLFACSSERQLRQAAADDLGRIDLKPETTLGELKTLLRDQNPEVITGSVKNQMILTFRRRLVYAYFRNEFYSSTPQDNWAPIRLEAYAPFKGTIAGMSIGVSYESALDNVKKFYPNARIETDSYGNSINLRGTREDTWTLSRTEIQDGDLKWPGIEARASGYIYLPG